MICFLKKVRINKAKTVALFLLFALFLSVVAVNANETEEDNERRYKEAVTRVRCGIEKYEDSIDISDLSISRDELGRIFSDAVKDTPYLFYVSNNLTYTYYTNGSVVAVKPKYTMGKKESEEAVLYCREEIEKMASLASRCESDLEKLVFAHDLICQRFSYDLSLESNNMYSFLKSGKGTCQGYTWTYMALLRELGIECRYVASDTVMHIWLAVMIDGEWYHSDVTWDDPQGNENGGEYKRAHILFSDEKADKDGYIDRYCSDNIKCQNKLYDGENFSSILPFCIQSGDLDHDKKVDLYDLLLIRHYLKCAEKAEQKICCACADTDRDLDIDETDVVYIRRTLLENISP